jgi:hypothetical protein
VAALRDCLSTPQLAEYVVPLMCEKVVEPPVESQVCFLIRSNNDLMVVLTHFCSLIVLKLCWHC